MLQRFLILVFFIPSLSSAASWYERIDTTVEVGIYQPLLSGSITNLVGPSTFQKSFSYYESKASLFSLNIKHDFDYIPNIDISYFNLQDAKSATLSQSTKVANGTFSGAVATSIDYQLFSAVIYQDFRIKGKQTSLFGKKIYSGDVEFDIGLNTQLFAWNFSVQSLSNLTQAPSWISVNEFIPVPYIAMKYYWYAYTLTLKAGSLAFSKAKSTFYDASINYHLVDGLYVSGGYLYEQFKVIESEDTLNFATSGFKVSFKYKF